MILVLSRDGEIGSGGAVVPDESSLASALPYMLGSAALKDAIA